MYAAETLSREELKVYFKGGIVDPMVKRYQDMLLKAEHLIMIFPIWWSDVPAMLKGWIDKVMLVGSTWTLNEEGKLYGMRWNPDDRIYIGNNDLNKIHKVVAIYL